MREATAREAVLQPVIVWQSPYDFGELPYAPVDEEKIAAGARERLDKMLAEVTRDDEVVRVDPLVLHGDPAQVLRARSAEATLLVVGSRGHGGFEGLLLGSVSTKCAYHSRCPLVIVPHGDPSEGGGYQPVRRILAGVDGSPGSRRALSWAIDEAALHRAQVDAVTVWHDIYSDEMAFEYQVSSVRHDEHALFERTRQQLTRIIAQAAAGHPGVAVSPHVLAGDPARALCARSAAADLLVVGSRGHGRFARLVLGSVGTACAHHSQCPIAIIPAAGP